MLLCESSGSTDQRKHAVGAGCVLQADAITLCVTDEHENSMCSC